MRYLHRLLSTPERCESTSLILWLALRMVAISYLFAISGDPGSTTFMSNGFWLLTLVVSLTSTRIAFLVKHADEGGAVAALGMMGTYAAAHLGTLAGPWADVVMMVDIGIITWCSYLLGQRARMLRETLGPWAV